MFYPTLGYFKEFCVFSTKPNSASLSSVVDGGEIRKLQQERTSSSDSLTQTVITKKYQTQYPILGLLSDDYQYTPPPVRESKTIVIKRTGEMTKKSGGGFGSRRKRDVSFTSHSDAEQLGFRATTTLPASVQKLL
ncbi:protein POF1B isoform X1 [Tachysurus ichikawai]